MSSAKIEIAAKIIGYAPVTNEPYYHLFVIYSVINIISEFFITTN